MIVLMVGDYEIELKAMDYNWSIGVWFFKAPR